MNKLLCASISIGLSALAAQAATIVDLSGDYNTGGSHINFVMPPATAVGEALVCDNDFSTALVVNGATASKGSTYTGPTIYGSFRHYAAGGPPAMFTTARVQLDDRLTLLPALTAGEGALDFVYLFKKADFANGLHEGPAGFDSSCAFSVVSSIWNGDKKSLRAVVKNGDIWYISKADNAGKTGTHIILSDAASAEWAVWDPLTTLDFSAINFSTTVTGKTFTDIQAVGIYGHLTKSAGGTPFQAQLMSIKIDAVAVPGTILLGRRDSGTGAGYAAMRTASFPLNLMSLIALPAIGGK
jgi:hypothetical protein